MGKIFFFFLKISKKYLNDVSEQKSEISVKCPKYLTNYYPISTFQLELQIIRRNRF